MQCESECVTRSHFANWMSAAAHLTPLLAGPEIYLRAVAASPDYHNRGGLVTRPASLPIGCWVAGFPQTSSKLIIHALFSTNVILLLLNIKINYRNFE